MTDEKTLREALLEVLGPVPRGAPHGVLFAAIDELVALRERAKQRAPKIDNQRMLDLLRVCRGALFVEHQLINEEEFAWLASLPSKETHARLDDYDALRARVKGLEEWPCEGGCGRDLKAVDAQHHDKGDGSAPWFCAACWNEALVKAHEALKELRRAHEDALAEHDVLCERVEELEAERVGLRLEVEGMKVADEITTRERDEARAETKRWLETHPASFCSAHQRIDLSCRVCNPAVAEVERLKAEKARCNHWYLVPCEEPDGKLFLRDGQPLFNIIRHHEPPFESAGSGSYTHAEATKVLKEKERLAALEGR